MIDLQRRFSCGC